MLGAFDFTGDPYIDFRDVLVDVIQSEICFKIDCSHLLLKHKSKNHLHQ